MSRRIVLFSQPSPQVFDQLASALFPDYITSPIFAYMPSEGDSKDNEKYTPIWQDFAARNHSQFIFVDNSQRGDKAAVEAQKILSANILLITGGNTFALMNHLRLSGLDEVTKQFWQKDNTVLSGFSAGAIVLSPSIDIAGLVGDINHVGLTKIAGLNITDFEFWPHFDPQRDKEILEKYQQNCRHAIMTASNEEIKVVDL